MARIPLVDAQHIRGRKSPPGAKSDDHEMPPQPATFAPTTRSAILVAVLRPRGQIQQGTRLIARREVTTFDVDGRATGRAKTGASMIALEESRPRWKTAAHRPSGWWAVAVGFDGKNMDTATYALVCAENAAAFDLNGSEPSENAEALTKTWVLIQLRDAIM